MTNHMDSFPNNKLYKIFPKIQLFPPLHYSYSRKEQVILNRLLIGHTHLTHSYLLNKEQPPTVTTVSVIFVNENENENYQKWKNNDSVNEN